MARVLGYINAILRGKLGGNVHSANRYGEYVRQYVKPVNPNTFAQSRVRGNFSEAVGMWHSLSSTKKDAWQAYATMVGGLSGINVFVGQRQRAIVNQREAVHNSPTGQLGDETFTTSDYAAPTDPPEAALSPPVGVAVGDTTITAAIDGTINVDQVFPTVGGVDIPVGTFSPGWGFSVYVSNEVSQNSHFISNPLSIKGDVSLPFSEITAGSEPTPSQNFLQNFVIEPGDYQDFPSNNYARLTFYWETTDGRKLLIGSKNAFIPPQETI